MLLTIQKSKLFIRHLIRPKSIDVCVQFYLRAYQTNDRFEWKREGVHRLYRLLFIFELVGGSEWWMANYFRIQWFVLFPLIFHFLLMFFLCFGSFASRRNRNHKFEKPETGIEGNFRVECKFNNIFFHITIYGWYALMIIDWDSFVLKCMKYAHFTMLKVNARQ